MRQMQMKWPPFGWNLRVLAVGLFVLWILSIPGGPLHGMVRDYMLVSQRAVVDELQLWTVVTYALWHADFMHLLFNVGVLWLFGGEIASRWSASKWWGFNAACALGGGLAVVATQAVLQTQHPTLGYSGAVLGVVAAFAWQNWNRTVYLFFFPVKGKFILLVFIALDLLLVVGAREPISISAHLGGMLTGLILVTGWWRPSRWKRAWKKRKRQKKREKFDVVSRSPESDRYVN